MANDFEKLIVTNEETEQRIKEGIEKHRKGNFKIKFSSVKPGTKVKVRLKNHKFRFGANLFMLDEFPDDRERKNTLYRERFKEVFNLATLPFYWDATEPEEGKTRYEKGSSSLYRRPTIDLCMEYCEENNIEPREHALCYTNDYPKWLEGKSFEEFKPLMEKRMQEISSRYGDKISTIEVTNEMFYPESAFDFYFRDDYIEYCFKLADKYFPNNKLGINELHAIWNGNATIRDAYYGYISDTLHRGCRIDLIGMQYHMFHTKENYYQATRRFYNIPHLFKMLDQYSKFGKPIEITEITIPAYSGEADKEEEQADIIEKLYSLWFSHPNVEKIIYWNLVDGYAWASEPGDMSAGENIYYGGLLRFDLTEKPAFNRLKKLIKETWSTNEVLSVEDNGELVFRGFYGDYEIIVESENANQVIEAKFYKDNDEVVIK